MYVIFNVTCIYPPTINIRSQPIFDRPRKCFSWYLFWYWYCLRANHLFTATTPDVRKQLLAKIEIRKVKKWLLSKHNTQNGVSLLFPKFPFTIKPFCLNVFTKQSCLHVRLLKLIFYQGPNVIVAKFNVYLQEKVAHTNIPVLIIHFLIGV